MVRVGFARIHRSTTACTSKHPCAVIAPTLVAKSPVCSISRSNAATQPSSAADRAPSPTGSSSKIIPLAHAESSFTVPMGIGAAVPAPYPSAEGHSPLAGLGPASGLGTLAARSRNRAYGIRLGPYLTIFTVPRLTGWAFGGAMSETMPVLKFITKMSVDQRTPVWLNHAIISILWPMGSAV